MLRSIVIAVALALVFGPAAARAQDAGGAEEDVAPVLAIPAVDDLGRPFPDPLLVRQATARTILGAGAVGVGAGLLVGGLFLGSALARGQVEGETPSYVALGGLLGGGLGLLSGGLPTLSVGVFTTKQLDRTIIGAEKVPRTVANEKRFWNAVMGEHIGRTIAINGGGTLLMGVVVLAGVSATVDTEFYDARYWAAVPATFGLGAGFVALGVLIEQSGRKKQEAIRDEVDPYRQKLRLEQNAAPGADPPEASEPAPAGGVQPIFGIPMPSFVPLPPTAKDGGGVSVGLTWSVAF